MKNDKKDILILCQYFYPDVISSSLLPFETAKSFIEQGYVVDVFTGKTNKEYLNNETVDGININRVKYRFSKKNNFMAKLVNYFNFTWAIYRKKRKLKNYKVIIVYSNPPILPWVAAKIAQKNKSKLVFVSYDVYPEIAIRLGSISQNSIITKIMNKINKKLYKQANKVITLSAQMKNFISVNRKFSLENIITIPNWHTDDYSSISSIHSQLYEKDDDSILITYLGNLGTAQDEKLIVRLIIDLNKEEKYEKIKFLFVGNGNKMNKLRLLKEEYDLNNLDILNFVTGEKLSDIKKKSDAYLVTLNEDISDLAVPSKIYTYLNEGKPIISILPSGMDIYNDLVNYNTGINVQHDEYSILKSKVIEMCNDYKLIKKYSEGSKKLYKDKYLKDYSLLKYKEIIKGLMEDKHV